jgi:hypothetical protein
MQGSQGILLIGIAIFLLWMGVTGRFEQLIAALGMVKNAPSQAPVTGSPTMPTTLLQSTPFTTPIISTTSPLVKTSAYQAGGMVSWASPGVNDPTLSAQFLH